MRSDRRHELQTNELSAQIERVSETVKQNATLLTAVIVGAIVIVGAGLWFVNHRANAESSAWARLQPGVGETDTAMLLSQFEAVARDNVSPEITRNAWLQVGATALSELVKNRDQTEAPNPERRRELRERAAEAFAKVAADPGKDVTALGRALMGLGALAEDSGDFEKARTYYERVTGEDSLKSTPIAAEAAYRLEHMSEWMTPIEFPAPVAPPLLIRPEAEATEPAAPAGTFVPPAGLKPKEPETPASASDSAEATDVADPPVDTPTSDEAAQPASNDGTTDDAPPTDEPTETADGGN